MENPGLEIKGSYRNTDSSHIDWWYGGGGKAWANLPTALQNIPVDKRYGLTIAVEQDSAILEYWWPDSLRLQDSDIIRKIDEATEQGYTKQEIDNLFTTIPVVTRQSLEITNVNNTADIDKPISTATQTALDNKADKSQLAVDILGLQTLVEELRAGISSHFSEFKIFTYLGQPEVIIPITHTPKETSVVMLFDQPLNEFRDYRYEGSNIILYTTELTLNREYSLYISYFK